jgi:hypothetical protein
MEKYIRGRTGRLWLAAQKQMLKQNAKAKQTNAKAKQK